MPVQKSHCPKGDCANLLTGRATACAALRTVKQGGCTGALDTWACLLHIVLPNSSAVLLCRQMLEASTAVQCPSVAYQLAGTKKVQQDLAAAGTLEHFLPEQADRDVVDACCAGLLCPSCACFAIEWGSASDLPGLASNWHLSWGGRERACSPLRCLQASCNIQ